MASGGLIFRGAAFSGDGKLLLSPSGSSLKLFGAGTAESVGTLEGHADDITCVAPHPKEPGQVRIHARARVPPTRHHRRSRRRAWYVAVSARTGESSGGGAAPRRWLDAPVQRGGAGGATCIWGRAVSAATAINRCRRRRRRRHGSRSLCVRRKAGGPRDTRHARGLLGNASVCLGRGRVPRSGGHHAGGDGGGVEGSRGTATACGMTWP
eukprot:358159-Chlamydomonas_euryale.AAC.1